MTVSAPVARSAARDRDPVVVLAVDDNFAMPLATTVRSVLDNLASDRKLRVFVLDGGIEAATKERLLRSWPVDRFDIEWLAVDGSALAGLPVSGHINIISYYRILISRVMPTDMPRAIYLDADLIVRADLARLWDHDLSGRWCLAAQDCTAPYLDASQALSNYQKCRPHLGAAHPVPNFRELGLEPQAAYFNAGVLLIDLAAWRNADLSSQLLMCLKQHRQHVVCWDQYALNVVLAGAGAKSTHAGTKGRTSSRFRRGNKARSIARRISNCTKILISFTSRRATSRGSPLVGIHSAKSSSNTSIAPLGPAGVRRGSRGFWRLGRPWSVACDTAAILCATARQWLQGGREPSTS